MEYVRVKPTYFTPLWSTYSTCDREQHARDCRNQRISSDYYSDTSIRHLYYAQISTCHQWSRLQLRFLSCRLLDFNCRLSLLKIQLKYHTVNWREKLTIVLKHFRKKTTKFYKKYVCSLLAGGWKN